MLPYTGRAKDKFTDKDDEDIEADAQERIDAAAANRAAKAEKRAANDAKARANNYK